MSTRNFRLLKSEEARILHWERERQEGGKVRKRNCPAGPLAARKEGGSFPPGPRRLRAPQRRQTLQRQAITSRESTGFPPHWNLQRSGFQCEVSVGGSIDGFRRSRAISARTTDFRIPVPE